MTVDEHFKMKMDIKTGDNICPNCGSDALHNFGTGTQKIEMFINPQ